MNDEPAVSDIFASWGQRLRKARDDKGLSQPKLAKAIGLNQGTVSRAEAGVWQSLPTVLAMARALDLTLVDLAEGDLDQVQLVVADALGLTRDELREAIDILAAEAAVAV